MKIGPLVCVAVLLMAQLARAGDGDLDISSQPKKLGDKAGGTHHVDELVKREQWGYTITLENKTFKPLNNLEVDYVIFYKHVEFGSKAPPQKKQVSGTYTVPAIASLDKVSFDTNPVELTKAELLGPTGGYAYFTNGGRGKADDALIGISVRVMLNGALFGQYSNPSDLDSADQGN